MRYFPHLLLVLILSTGYAQSGEIELILPRTAKPFEMMLASSVAVVGKVSKIETDLVEVAAFEGAPKEVPKQPFKIANVKISEAHLGAKGLNSVRVGFPANAYTGDHSKNDVKGGDILQLSGVALTEGQEGIFILRRHFEGDFYEFASIPSTNPTLFEKSAVNFDTVLDLVKSYSLAIKDPVTALNAKTKGERIQIVSFLAQRYRLSENHKRATEEVIPAEETKLILQALLELPWAISETNPQPYRSLELNFNKWVIRENTSLKFAYPQYKVETPPEEVQKLYKEAVTKFVNENIEKITLKKYSEKR